MLSVLLLSDNVRNNSQNPELKVVQCPLPLFADLLQNECAFEQGSSQFDKCESCRDVNIVSSLHPPLPISMYLCDSLYEWNIINCELKSMTITSSRAQS